MGIFKLTSTQWKLHFHISNIVTVVNNAACVSTASSKDGKYIANFNLLNSTLKCITYASMYLLFTCKALSKY